MQKLFSLIAFIFCSQIYFGQTVVSTCNANDSVIKLYSDDANRLVLREIFKTNNTYKDSARIPKGKVDTVLNALLAVHNATILPAQDTVVNLLNIHTYVYQYGLHEILITADSNLTWMQQLHQGNLITSNLAINNLIAQYNLSIKQYYKSLITPFDMVVFKTDSSFNMNAIAQQFRNINSVHTADPNGYVGDGNDITDSVKATYVELNFIAKWDDCPSGCISYRFWKFKVYYNCAVEYVGSYGAPLESGLINSITNISNQNILIYPNPFIETIFVTNEFNNTKFTLNNLLSQTVKTGIIEDNKISQLNNLPNGIYFLKLEKEQKQFILKLIKN